jgi:hypothetical protein
MTIQVCLMAFRDPETWDDQTIPIVERLDPERALWDEVPAGMFPYLRVGDIWQHGSLIESPAYEYAEFRGLDIRDERSGAGWRDGVTCELVWGNAKVSVPAEAGSAASIPLITADTLRLNPPRIGGYHLHTPHTSGVLYLRIALPGTTDILLLPCSEVVRYYYATSNRLTSAVFSGFERSKSKPTTVGESDLIVGIGERPRHLDELYNPVASGQVTKRTKRIQLRMQFENEDGFVGARLFFSDYARREALSIGAALTRSEVDERMPVLMARLPYSGPTTLGVRGVWTETIIGTRSVRQFVVFRIVKCGGPVPFERLKIARDNPRGEPGDKKNDDGGGGKDNQPRAKRRGTPGTSPSEGGEIKPNPLPSLLSGLKKAKLMRPEFEAPFSIEVEVPTASGEPSGWGDPLPEGETDGLSPQPGTYRKSKLQRLSLIDNLPRSLAEPPEDDAEEEKPKPVTRLQLSLRAFKSAASRVASERGWILDWIDPYSPGGGSDGVMFPLLDESGKRRAWSYVEPDRNGDEGRRRFLIAHFTAGSRHAYVVEAERRLKDTISALLLAHASGQELPDRVFVTLIGRCVGRGAHGRGIWGDKLEGVKRFQTIQHGQRPTDPQGQAAYVERFAELLRERLDGVFERMG